MKWKVTSSWTYGKKEAIELVMELAMDEKKYGKVESLKVEKLGCPIIRKDKSEWLVIKMIGTAEQKEEVMERLLERMNGPDW